MVATPGLTNGESVVATATDATNDTSAFSNSVATANAFLVINTMPGGSGSLFSAIQNADSVVGGGATITFAIPGSGPYVITLATTYGALPPITASTTIDGTSQPGYSGTPIIEINGSALATGSGLELTAGGSTIKGLEIVDFAGAGIDVESSDDLIVNNLIGTDGTAADNTLGNQVGIFVDGSNGGTGATIGGMTSGSANIIGFNTSAGVSIGGTGSTGDLVIGNFIGTNATGGNLGNPVGVSVASAGNTIGGTSSGTANIIGFGSTAGVSISGTDNLIVGNFIGTDSAGASLSNAVGVQVSDSGGNTIGGATSGAGNTIGFNSDGISLAGAGNQVLGNFIGTDAAGVNQGNVIGVLIRAANNTIGGTAADTIAFNSTAGIAISANDNVVIGEFIGTDTAGASLGNGVGVQISAGGSSNTIGGTVSSMADIIGDNTGSGISIAGSTNLVEGDLIGTNSANANLNNVIGVLVTGSANTIGGLTAGAAVTIAFNTTAGIELNGTGATLNVVAGDFIGTNSGGSADLYNGVGVQVGGGSSNTIGGTVSGSANTIGFYTTAGIALLSGSGNEIHGNTYIETIPNPTPPPASQPTFTSDISLSLGANNNQPAPVLLGTTLNTAVSPNVLSVLFTDDVPSSASVSLDVYLIDPSSLARVSRVRIRQPDASHSQRADRHDRHPGQPDSDDGFSDSRNGDGTRQRHVGLLEHSEHEPLCCNEYRRIHTRPDPNSRLAPRSHHEREHEPAASGHKYHLCDLDGSFRDQVDVRN